jgi:Uma2 family endonuclease
MPRTLQQVRGVAEEDFPLLETGYHLDADEFHRRYKLMPEGVRAELIEGIVYMASPVTVKHSQPHSSLIGWCWYYTAQTPGIVAELSATVKLGPKNEFQPDGLLYYPEHIGGTTRIKDDYIEGAPEFVFEVSNSTTAMDLHEKFQAYERAGVREYLVWQVALKRADWFVRKQSGFESLSTNDTGILRSVHFPGLWLNVPALLGRDQAKILSTIQAGMSSPEHAEFVKRLQGGGK